MSFRSQSTLFFSPANVSAKEGEGIPTSGLVLGVYPISGLTMTLIFRCDWLPESVTGSAQGQYFQKLCKTAGETLTGLQR